MDLKVYSPIKGKDLSNEIVPNDRMKILYFSIYVNFVIA